MTERKLKNMKYRHGDVGIEKVSPPPRQGRKTLPHLVLAEGEATGHSHRVKGNAVLYEWSEQLYLRVKSRSAVVHQEHARIELPRGTYRIIQQREWSPKGPRRVID